MIIIPIADWQIVQEIMGLECMQTHVLAHTTATHTIDFLPETFAQIYAT